MAVAVFTAIAFAAFFLENDHFVSFDERCEHFTNHFGAFYSGSTHLYSSVNIRKKHTVKFNLVSLLGVFTKVMNIQELVRLSLKLLSLDFYNCVHPVKKILR